MRNREKVLVLVTDYPGEHSKEVHRFVHTRNLYYQNSGIDVTVLSFAAGEDYSYEGIPVITLKTFRNSKVSYNLLLAHQPNIRCHYRFLLRFGDHFPGIILFFHGHEVLRFKKAYPPSYPFMSQMPFKPFLRDCYDLFKLSVWRRYIPKIMDKTTLVFVSEWMMTEFLRYTGIKPDELKGHYRIIYNSVGRLFQERSYDPGGKKDYDFITIRSNLDGSKYAIDVVNDMARNNPQGKFLLIGKGEFFHHYKKAENITWVDRTLNHPEIIDALQTARCAFMPSKSDTQGLMTCEMATFRMPVITSDLPVCHEVFNRFENVEMISNDTRNIDLLAVCERLEKRFPFPVHNEYCSENTSAREVSLIRSVIRGIT